VTTRFVFADARPPWQLHAVGATAPVSVRAEPLPMSAIPGVQASIAAMRFTIDSTGQRDGAIDWSLTMPEALSRAVPKRCATYLAGRACASVALYAAGHSAPVPPVTRDDHGAPVWPGGFVGSIAHTDGESIAIVSPTDALLGVDIERVMSSSTAEQVARRIAPELTNNAVDGAGALDPSLAMTLAFSAKETVYKCLHPLVRRFFGFEVARVVAMTDGGWVHLELTEPLHERLPTGTRLAVGWAMESGVVVTGMELRIAPR
jgi:enterobactin synthetase component D